MKICLKTIITKYCNFEEKQTNYNSILNCTTKHKFYKILLQGIINKSQTLNG